MHDRGALNEYKFHELWPLSKRLQLLNPWSKFVNKFYSKLTNEDLFYSSSLKKWKLLTDSFFLDPKIFPNSSSKESMNCIKEILFHLKKSLVDLPESYHIHLDLKSSLINQEEFVKLFFSNLNDLNVIQQSRNYVIKMLLIEYACSSEDEVKDDSLGALLESRECIPCSESGNTLKKCTDLVHPESNFANLYIPTESMFPWEELLKSTRSDAALKKLSIMYDIIPWKFVVERATTVQCLMQLNQEMACNRVKHIIEAITKHTRGDPPKHISTINFLPTLKKPQDFLLNWPGESVTIGSGNDVIFPGTDNSNVFIAGSQSIFISQDCLGMHIDERVETILGLRRVPTMESVIEHFKLVISHVKHLDLKWIEKVCVRVYDYLQDHLSLNLQDFTEIPIAWTGQDFIYINQICFQWSLNGPYLYKVPAILESNKQLCKYLNVKNTFSFEEIKQAMDKMKEDNEGKVLDEQCQKIVSQVISLVQTVSHDARESIEKGCLSLPDTSFCLHRSDQLAYNDAPWIQLDNKYALVHDYVPRELAIKLGVKPVRANLLEQFKSAQTFKGGVAFGQRELLTRRIQNILRDYPLDITLLKELLQNADDAKANKLYIILDKRYHGTSSLLSENWDDLQGPALLAWNDSVFSEDDLEGIQKLGLGSKRSDTETIGQYGIGFNVVYHVTDCPSFISNDRTMCIMDPHCRYTPGSNELCPGRRFDDIQDGFWDIFPDMKSAYLRTSVANLPAEVIGGSLFRFPIRHEKRKIKESEIVDGEENLKSTLSSTELECLLKEWMRKMKEAMLFLNHVTELRLYLIEEDKNELNTVFDFKTKVNDTARKDQYLLLQSVSNFKHSKGCPSRVITYPLDLIEKGSVGVDRWLIHQGVGDINNSNQEWRYIKSTKPRHGIAAPLLKDNQEFHGQVFCFLPLPVKSGFPVHINGHFILNSTRRELWKSSDVTATDNRSTWNNNLIEAISSSYTKFLEASRPYYVLEKYDNLDVAIKDIKHYYNLFPTLTNSRDNYWSNLVIRIYNKIIAHNVPVFCVPYFEATENKYVMKWFLPRASNNANQVYYLEPSDYLSPSMEKILSILQRIGMKITPAPFSLIRCFQEIKTIYEEVSNFSTFKYYTSASEFSRQTMESAIENTVFQNVDSFVQFTTYLLQGKNKEYPKDPFSHNLLLTADGMLRKFDERKMVFNSIFSNLFPNSLSCFLHPALQEISFSRKYFIQPEVNIIAVKKLILRLMNDNLPPVLKTCCISDLEKIHDCMSHDKLESLWKCFKQDPVFEQHVKDVLQEWALLLSKDGRLYSCSNRVLPVNSSSANRFSAVITVLNKVDFPMLNTAVVIGRSYCPSIVNGLEMFTNIYFFNKEKSLSTTLLSRNDLNALINYLKQGNVFPTKDSKMNQQLQSIPLFENIDGSYTSVDNKEALIWPQDVCKAGHQTWLTNSNVAFINAFGQWNKLGDANDLEISPILVENFYVRLVFPSFCKMTENERYDQLQHIRDCLFEGIRHCQNIKIFQSEIDGSRFTFILKLKQLKCIGENEALHSIQDFSDHTVPLFRAFHERFLFLPAKYQDSKWLAFFKQLGLKHTVSTSEFQDLCLETEKGKRENILECSDLLLNYLYSKFHRSRDSDFFNRISQIAFIIQNELLSNLTWLAPPAIPQRQMIKLQGSAPLERASIVWTTKPIIKLPYGNSNLENSKLESMLGIARNPDFKDVIANIENISKTEHSQWNHFTNYPSNIQCPTGHQDLIHITNDNLSYLNDYQLQLCHEDVTKLKNIPCVPVFHTISKSPDIDRHKMVLVKPCQVVAHSPWNDDEHNDVEDFHPFLHILPKDFTSLTTILPLIGVKNFQLSHIQVVLELVNTKLAGEELDLNTKECVKKAIVQLDKFLQRSQRGATSSLYPLYLPDIDDKMRESKSLLYVDSMNYPGDYHLDLTEVPYYHFDIRTADMSIGARELCQLLPEDVRPIGISTVCTQRVASSTTCSKSVSKTAAQITKTLTFPQIPQGLVCFIIQYIGGHIESTKLKSATIDYFAGIKVVSVDDLRMDLVMNDSQKNIGSIPTKFCYVSEDTKWTLYLDNSLGSSDTEDAYQEISEHLNDILHSIIPDMKSKQEIEIHKLVVKCLKANTEKEVIATFLKKGVQLDVKMESFQKKLGEEVPLCWHHRLAQDLNNVFNPMEYVGYESEDNHIVVAQVAYPIPLKQGEETLEKKYHIYVKPDDRDGIEVGVLTLYKFLISSKIPKFIADETSSSNSITAFDENSELPKLRSNLIEEELVDTLCNLCSLLRDIWKLSGDLRKKAIRRLFLKWHPDKNEDPIKAEKVFKFLLKQIEHLEKGEPLDDPKTFTSCSSRGSHGPRRYNRYWSHYKSRYKYSHWNNSAYQHHQSYKSEKSFFNDSGGGSSTGSNSGSGSSTGSNSGSGSSSSSTRYTTHGYFPFGKIEDDRDTNEGWRWILQAEAEFKVLAHVHDNQEASSGYGYVCFMSHQVAEKALKGGVYAFWGMDGRRLIDHNLSRHAYALQAVKSLEMQGLIGHCTPIEDYYLKTRYPNQWKGCSDIPFDHYTKEDADAAIVHAEEVLEIVKGAMPSKN